jgi:prevent-host-death family protein
MMVNIHEAKTHLSRLMNRALAGEEIIIAKSGTPLLKLVPLHNTKKARVPGLSRGEIEISDDFAEPLPDHVIGEFEE